MLMICFNLSAFAAENPEAQFLSSSGIMVGSNGDLDLDGVFTVEQLMTVLSRLQGVESIAKNYNTLDLFKDVPKDRWSASYISWAKATGISNGNPDGTIGYHDPVSTQRMCAFLLRTMGYTDIGWNEVYEVSQDLGLLDSVNLSPTQILTRGDVAKMVYNALESATSDGSSLGNELGLSKFMASEKLTAVEISQLASPAVVYIETYDADGYMLASGSGFILTADGQVITNYHVMAGATTAIVKLIDGTIYDVADVASYDQYRDVALIRLSSASNLPTVAIGDSDDVVSGEGILTIGSPIGLENTISDGLISNVSRYVDDLKYFQISAPISSGSSGGALLNFSGEVIGITSATYLDGQNLNLAIPINEAMYYFEGQDHFALADLYDPTADDYEYGYEDYYSEEDYEYVYYDDASTYYGQVVDGIPEGNGSMVFANGDTYYGTWSEGLMDGYGEYIWANGDYYSGDFIMDIRTGYGYYSWPDESSYYGYFIDGSRNGYGTFNPDPYNYVSGEWLNDELVREFDVPQDVTATLVSGDRVMIEWSPIDEATGYYIYYSVDGEGWYYLNYSETTSTTSEWQMLEGEHLYFYVTGIIEYFTTGTSDVIDITM